MESWNLLIMESDTFLTIASESTGVYKEKGSKFLAFVYPVSNEEEAREKVDFLHKKFHDARHHCYAWRIGLNGEHCRVNDDGEPAHSAGKPILGQLVAHGVTNVLAVVVRYFGGTLLGVGGLMQAYKLATIDALAHAKTVTDIITETWQLTFDYPYMNQVLKIVKEMNIDCYTQDFNIHCIMMIKVRKSRTVQIEKRFNTVESLIIEKKLP